MRPFDTTASKSLRRMGTVSKDHLEVRGQWWLPASPGRKVPGTLTFSPARGGELTLIGALRTMFEEGERTTNGGTVTITMTEAAMDASGQYGRILGEAANDVYTLDDCFRVHSTNRLFGGNPTETIRVNRVFKGAIFQPDEPLEATAVSFSTEHLASWIMESGLSEAWTWRQDGAPLTDEPRFRIEARDLPERQISCDSGHSVRLRHRVGISGDDLTRRCLSQRFSWRIDGTAKLGIDSLVDLASDLQDLVSMAANRPVAFESMQFWHPDVVMELPDERSTPMPIDLYAR